MAHIAIIGKYYKPFSGGIEHVTEQQAEYIAKKHVVDVIVSAHDRSFGDENISGVNVIRLKRNILFKSQPICFSVLWRLNLKRYDIVHFHGPNPFFATVLFLKIIFSRYRGKLVVTHHADVYGRKLLKAVTAPFYKALMKRAFWVSVTSAKNAEISTDIPRLAKIVVLPLCIDAREYEMSAEEKERAEVWRTSLFGEKPLVGFVGRHARYKGIDVLLRAISRIEGISAVIAGDGPYSETLKTQAAELGISDRVLFVGAVSEEKKKEILKAIDVFVFPSTETSEAFGIGQLEAMYIGAVVVASNLPTGVTDVSVDNETAILARPGDEVDLARKIDLALRDAELRQKIRAGASRHIREYFDKSVVLDRYTGLIEWALNENNGKCI